MGNRAVITMVEKEGENFFDNAGIYLHWNGGSESVRNFLLYAKMQNMEHCQDYALARLTQVIGNYFGGTLSIGIGVVKEMDFNNSDNGLYIIDNRFNIIENVSFIEHDENDPLWDELPLIKLLEAGIMEKVQRDIEPYDKEFDIQFLKDINSSQPKQYQFNVRTMRKLYKELTATK